jgi:hypothetical protein
MNILTTLALKNVYPEYQWKEVRTKKSKGYWDNMEHQRAFLDNAAISLNIKKPEDWNSITQADIRKLGGGTLLQQYSGSLTRGLQRVL